MNRECKDKNAYPENKTRQLIREAELLRARIHDVPGKDFNLSFNNEFFRSAMVDETYQLVASHADKITQEKIINGDYIDFGHLVPKDHILTAEDNR